MNIQLIAVDMDGTLLDQHSQITRRTAETIRRLKDHQVEFLICSGRDYRDARQLVESSGIHCSYICLSGAEIYDQDGRRILCTPLTAENLDDISRIFGKRRTPMDILSENGRYTTESRKKKLLNICRFLFSGKKLPDPIPDSLMKKAADRVRTIHFIHDLWEACSDDNIIYKICGNDIPEDMVIELKKEFQSCPDLAAASSFPTNIELTNRRAQKGIALEYYASLKGIPLEAVMTIGDSDNDLSMFTPAFGWTVAMANSMDCIKQAAKYHTLSNREDGVAYAVERYVLKDSN